MNIIIYVLAILAATTLFTYAKFTSFHDKLAIREILICYLTTPHTSQKELYIATEGKGNERPNASGKAPGTRYLNILYLVHADLASTHPNITQSTATLFKRLCKTLFEQELFYQEAQEKLGPFLDRLVDEIWKASTKINIKRKGDLANLELSDQTLQEVFAKMLRGQAENGCDKKKTTSLLKYLRLGHPNEPIRLFLAPDPLLFAIFQDISRVKKIKEERMYLYKQLKNNTKDKEAASAEFERGLRGHLPMDLDPALFDFTVSETKP